ncbi:MAG TPA: hypothetical protein VLF79_02495 [Candidatus Saccharimonadales bacterium]|nr:hypothetical protein [Candidatus Saccharimonadales bacterium]
MGEIEPKKPFDEGMEQPTVPVSRLVIESGNQGRSSSGFRITRGKVAASLSILALAAVGANEIFSKFNLIHIPWPSISINGHDEGRAEFRSQLQSIQPPDHMSVLEGQVRSSATVDTNYQMEAHTPLIDIGNAYSFLYNHTTGETTHRTVCVDHTENESIDMPDSAYSWTTREIPGTDKETVLVTVNPSLLRTSLGHPSDPEQGKKDYCTREAHDQIGAKFANFFRSSDPDTHMYDEVSYESDRVTQALCGSEMQRYVAAGIADTVGKFLRHRKPGMGKFDVNVTYTGGEKPENVNLTPGVPTKVPAIEADLKNRLGGNKEIHFQSNTLTCSSVPEAVRQETYLAEQSAKVLVGGITPVGKLEQ